MTVTALSLASEPQRTTECPPRMQGRAHRATAWNLVYRQQFDVVDANTPELLEEAHRLRFQVYCVENQYESPESNPEGLEADEFDSHSAHVLLRHRATDTFVGTVRLILPVRERLHESFAIQRVCTDPILQDSSIFPVTRMGEISRFSVSKRFRRRLGDTAYPRNEEIGDTPSDQRRAIPNMTLGLMQGIFRISVRERLTHLCAEMEPSLLRLLAGLGMHFTPIGPLVEFHGKRQPCFMDISAVFRHLRRHRPEILEILTVGGTLRRTQG